MRTRTGVAGGVGGGGGGAASSGAGSGVGAGAAEDCFLGAGAGYTFLRSDLTNISARAYYNISLLQNPLSFQSAGLQLRPRVEELFE